MGTYLSWVDEKVDLASDLGQGLCGAGYADGAIILCTCISALASRLWVESKGHDRKRFVELVTKFSGLDHSPKLISVPLLVQDHAEWRASAIITDKSFRLTADDDKTEDELMALRSTNLIADRKKLRSYSYANILYEDIRCGFAHTYLPTDNARIDDPLAEIFGRDLTKVSYVNRMSQNMRQIHFPLGWIASVAKRVAHGLDKERIQNNKQIGENIGIAVPRQWWIDGG
jgi:hypothetical protein